MTEKIDTQGMSGEAVKGCKDNVFPKDADGNPIYPPFNPTPLPIFLSLIHISEPTRPY